MYFEDIHKKNNSDQINLYNCFLNEEKNHPNGEFVGMRQLMDGMDQEIL